VIRIKTIGSKGTTATANSIIIGSVIWSIPYQVWGLVFKAYKNRLVCFDEYFGPCFVVGARIFLARPVVMVNDENPLCIGLTFKECFTG
jgi:hypothetical protein